MIKGSINISSLKDALFQLVNKINNPLFTINSIKEERLNFKTKESNVE